MAFANDTPRTVSQGIGPVRVTLAGTVYAGDLIGYSSGWKQADANAGIPAKLIAADDGVSGDVITAFQEAVVTSITGATAGSDLYLSDTAGSLAETASTTSKQKVGQVVSATEAYLNPHRFQETWTESAVFSATANDFSFFVAPFRCKPIAVKASWGTAGTGGGFQLERLQGTEAAGAGDELLSADIAATATANTVKSGTLVGTAATVVLEAGNRLGWHLESGGATSLADGVVTVELERA